MPLSTGRRGRPESRLAWFMLGSILALPFPAGAEEGRALDPVLGANPDSALALTLSRLEGAPLSLEEALERAVANAPALRVAEHSLDAARGSLRRERGAFDPELYGEAQRVDRDTPTASPFSGAEVLKTQETSVEAGARLRLPLGTEISASVASTRSETNSAFAALDPQYDATGLLTVRQPLLAGFGPSARAPLTAAERDMEAARALREDADLAVRADAEAIYWDLYAAERDYAVQVLIRDRARSLLEETRLRAGAGLVGPGSVANARVFLAEQEQAVLDRVERLDQVSDQLGSFMGMRPPQDLPRFRPTDEPPDKLPVVPPEPLVEAAFKSNRVLEAARRQAASLRARARGAGWDALPDLDVFGSIGASGLSGASRDVIFGGDTLRSAIDGGAGDALRQVTDRDFPVWSVGVSLTVPIGLREGLGERQRLRAEAARAEAQVASLERSLEEQVRASQRELAHGNLRLEAAREGVDAAFEQVRIGVIEYRNGRATAFELVRLGADLAAAQQRYSQALVRTAKAGADLKRLTGGAYPSELTSREGENGRP